MASPLARITLCPLFSPLLCLIPPYLVIFFFSQVFLFMENLMKLPLPHPSEGSTATIQAATAAAAIEHSYSYCCWYIFVPAEKGSNLFLPGIEFRKFLFIRYHFNLLLSRIVYFLGFDCCDSIIFSFEKFLF